MLLLLYYFYVVGFEFEVVIIFGLMIKFEYWVMLYKDEKVMLFFEQYKLLFCNLKKFVDVVVSFNVDSEYVVIFVSGGYGVFIGLFESQDVVVVLQWVIKNDCFVIFFCYGLVVFLVFCYGDNLLNGYFICVFLDVVDK